MTNSYFSNLVNSCDGEIYIIAEACDNHMGSLEIAKSLARAAKYAGADAVKFQHHLPEEEMLNIGKMSDNFDEHLFDFLKKNSLSLGNHILLKEFCDSINITYLCTPFSYKAAKEIFELVPFFKVGSGEFQDFWFTDKLLELGKPILFSSGMCEWEELCETFHRYKQYNCALMNCTSEYPPVYENLNLRNITNMIDEFSGTVIGHSDHTTSIFSSVIAASLGAQLIEKHITLSEFVNGPDSSVSLSPIQFKDLVDQLRAVRKTLGASKKVTEREKTVRAWAYRSLVAVRDIRNGEIIEASMICTKRPSGGIESKRYREFIGRELKCDVPKNSQLKEEFFK